MSGYGRALYSGSTSRLLWGGANNRALWGGPWSSITRLGWKRWAGLSTQNLRTEAAAQSNQDAAYAALRALSLTGTELTTNLDNDVAASRLENTAFNGGSVLAEDTAGRYRFTVPNRSSLHGLAVRATAMARFSKVPSVGNPWQYAWDHSTNMTLCLYFSNSTTAYATGADLWDATPDWSRSLADVNADQVATGRTADGDMQSDPLDFAMSATVIEKIQGFASDTVNVWCLIKRSGYIDWVSPDYADTIWGLIGGMSLRVQ